MQPEISTVAPALRALLEGFIDYAGLFPPAGLQLADALTNYNKYRNCEDSWLLRWFVVGVAELDQVPESLDGYLSVLTEVDNSRAASIETKSVVTAQRPVYCEVPADKLAQLDEVKASSNLAKIRAGGLTAAAIPSPSDLAAFILACAERRLAFKATAGLHHPFRAEHALTYEALSPRAFMHGFLNVLMASAFAWHGKLQIEAILCETDPRAFSFDKKAHWRDHSLDQEEIREARINFIHSVGSCSFEEPVADLKALNLI